ncbi:MAG: Holliday junction branch migration protein RuvA [Pseudomonadota bacterium]
MIGRLRGRVLEAGMTQLLLDVQGVGYEVEISLATHAAIAGSTEEIALFTHLVVREDAHQLFGFATLAERDLFRALIKVNGVGPRLAVTILSGMDAAGLVGAVRDKDVKALVALPGVGKKTAERLIIDLRDRLPEQMAVGPRAGPPVSDAFGDAEAALIGLGFKPQQAAMALSRVENPAADVETLIRQALKSLG